MITFDNLIALHEMLWPDTNLDQQIAKCKEEYNEWLKTEHDSEEELYEAADMIIVSAGIARFDYTMGLNYLRLSLYKFDDMPKLWQAVETKMLRNMRRNWVKKDDVGYHHTEEGTFIDGSKKAAPATEEQIKGLKSLVLPGNWETCARFCGHERLEDLTYTEARRAIIKLRSPGDILWPAR